MATAIPLNETDNAACFERLSDISKEPLRMLLPIEGHEKMPLVSLEEAIKPLIDNNIVSDIARKAYVAKEDCKQPADGLTSDESASILLYTMEWEPREKCLYFTLNEYLRDKQRDNLKPWFLFLKLFLTALDKLPTSYCTVYRGVKMNLSDQYKIDSTFIWWGFSSCTTNINTLQSERFLGKEGDRTMFAIECYSGKNIRAHSYYQYENEILLPPARQFKVVGSLDQGHGLHLIQLKEIEPPFALLEPVSIGKNLSPPSIGSLQVTEQLQIVNRNPKLDSIIQRFQCSTRAKITYQELTDRDIPTIVNEVIIVKACSELDLSNNQITSEGVSILASALKKNTTLKVLSLLNNHVCDIGIRLLADALAKYNSTLTMLGLGSNSITDEGVTYLAEMLRTNRTLTGLTLQNNQISSRGVRILMDTLARSNQKLTILNVSSNTAIDDVCVDSIITMINCNQTLKEFYMIKCNLSPASINKIQQVAKTKRYLDIRL